VLQVCHFLHPCQLHNNLPNTCRPIHPSTSGVVPTFPGPGQAFKEGGDCPISWNLDTTGKWTNFSVDLMSGSNFAMQTVSNVFKDRDGTKGETTYTWKCPTVTPTSAVSPIDSHRPKYPCPPSERLCLRCYRFTFTNLPKPEPTPPGRLDSPSPLPRVNLPHPPTKRKFFCVCE
jgi:hypothetical protein